MHNFIFPEMLRPGTDNTDTIPMLSVLSVTGTPISMNRGGVMAVMSVPALGILTEYHQRAPPSFLKYLSNSHYYYQKGLFMNLEFNKPSAPAYLLDAISNAQAALEEEGQIEQARHDARERLLSITEEMALLEDQLGELEAQSLLKRKPDSVKLAKFQDKLDALHAEQRKLQAAQKSLAQKDEEQEDKIIDASAQLDSAGRQLGRELMSVLDAQLEKAAQQVQEVLHVACAINRLCKFNEYSYRYQNAQLTSFQHNTPLIGLSAYTAYKKPEPEEICPLAAEWLNAIMPARAMLDRIGPIAHNIEYRQNVEREKEQSQREREERLKPRYV